MISSYLHIAAWLGLGGASTVAAIALGIFAPRYLFPALIFAAATGTATFIYAKGVHDDFVLQRQRELAAEQTALDNAAKVREQAARTVHNRGILFRSRGVRERYERAD